MDTDLQEYYNEDPGFAQFVERHGAVAAMPDIRKAYRRWEYDVMLDMLDEERRVAEMEVQLLASRSEGKAEGITEGKAEGRSEGKAETQMEISLKIFTNMKRSKDLSDIVDMLKELGIPDDIIEAAKTQVVAHDT